MQDPKPANISGSKRVSHSYTHRIDWGYVAAGVGMVALAFVVYRVFGPKPEEDESATFN